MSDELDELDEIRLTLLNRAWPRIANRDGISQEAAMKIAAAELMEIEEFVRAVVRDEVLFSPPPQSDEGAAPATGPGEIE